MDVIVHSINMRNWCISRHGLKNIVSLISGLYIFFTVYIVFLKSNFNTW